ncbi:hypothetical protein Trydic_g20125, partial [Trypoxylus dichotomus]
DIPRNQNLIIVRANKGNATVLMDRQNYRMKIQMLQDTNHYKKLNMYSTTKGRFSGIFRRRIFINVPLEEILEIIKQQLIPKRLQPDLINLARLCLTSTYFLWNGEFYEQASGAAMASPLSPVIPDIFMEAFEYEAIESSRMKPKCWYRYVDDTFVIWPNGPRTLEEFPQHINRQHANINFTMEIEEDGNLPFLDVLVERTYSNKLGHSVYRKKTHTNRYPHATSLTKEIPQQHSVKKSGENQ